jgi:hypothetical protein
MKLIAHRGNYKGSDPSKENSEAYILDAIMHNYDVEIDIRYINNKLFLGHDLPQYETTLEFLKSYSGKLWIHCKNIHALNFLLQFKELNIFWHQNDDYTITTGGYIWAYPGKYTLSNCIIVMPEWVNYKIGECVGICSDSLEYINKKLD